MRKAIMKVLMKASMNVLCVVIIAMMAASCNSGPSFVTANVGDIISFGGYDWIVLDVRDGRTLVISERLLEHRAYYDGFDITWEESDLRKYLNGEFYNSFSAADRAMIAQVTNVNPDNPWYGTPGGANTQDRIFLLSIDEVLRYFVDSRYLGNQNRPYDDMSFYIDAYDSAIKTRCLGLDNCPNDYGCLSLTLRSPGFSSHFFADVFHINGCYNNSLSFSGFKFISNVHGFRPAIWINP